MLRNLQLASTGNKQNFIDRLSTELVERLDVAIQFMKKWLMKPITTLFMKIGSANESNVIAALSSFLENNDIEYILENYFRQRGLIQRQDGPMNIIKFMATSVDGCVVLKYASRKSQHVACVMEIKTVMNNTYQIESSKRSSESQVLDGALICTVFRTQFGTDLYRKLVWTPLYRSQILHHCCVTSFQTSLFTVAGRSKINYCIFY